MENQITAGSILSLFETTKDQRQTFAEAAIADVENGTRSAVDMALQLKCMSDVIERIMSDKKFKEYFVTEAITRGKSFEVHNAKLNVRELGGKWDYSQTNDQVLFDLEAEAEAIKAKIAERQKLLKTIPAGGMADPETGNMIFKAAAPATSTTVVVTLK
jgi:hypothetical protein